MKGFGKGHQKQNNKIVGDYNRYPLPKKSMWKTVPCCCAMIVWPAHSTGLSNYTQHLLAARTISCIADLSVICLSNHESLPSLPAYLKHAMILICPTCKLAV